jgi:hypothetical protein
MLFSTKFFILVGALFLIVGLSMAEDVCQAEEVSVTREQRPALFLLALLEQPKETDLENSFRPVFTPVPDSPANYLLFKINYVYRSGGKGDFKQLTDGGVLRSGDHYKIIFTPTVTCYVYIFQIDSANKIYRLFPMESFGGVTVNNFNPVRDGKTYYIPAEKKSFVLDQQIGAEKIYFLSSRQRDPELEQQYEQYLEAQGQKSDLEQQLVQIDQVLQYAMEVRERGNVVFDPAETERNTWEEEGQTFSVLQQRLENLCDGCVYVLTFRHE